MKSLHSIDHNCTVYPTTTLSREEKLAIESDPAAMRAVIDGSTELPEVPCWLRFYSGTGEFCGAVGILNVLPNPLQVEYHLFYLSTAPKLQVRIFCELAHLYAILHRLQPYTVIRANPELQYMINFMRRMGMIEIPRHGKYFFFPDAAWQPKYVTELEVMY